MSELELEEDAEDTPSQLSTHPSKTQTPPSKGNMLLYDGQTGQIYKIWLLNFFMTIITLGIYRFWGKTRLRKYVASSFNLCGDRFEYTGNGGELFKGFSKSIPIFIATYAPLLIASFIGGEDAIWPYIFVFPIFLIFGVARFTSLRYRASHTQWRGIRGYLDGSALKYGVFALYRLFLNVITLGIAAPFSSIAKHRYIMTGMYFGNVPLEFNGDAKTLMKTHLITAVLAVPTLGISRFWYRAALSREKMNGLSAGQISFKSTVTGGSLLKHVSISIIIIVITLGLGTPVVMQRNMKYFARNTHIIGDMDTAEITQAENQKITVGEGLDDIFGMDTGLM